jgi:predicted nucleic acid-binding protein
MLADTSAWIEFLRGTGSPACVSVRHAIRRQTLAITDPIYAELLAGARPHEVDRLLRLLSEQDYHTVAPRLDWLNAAEIYRNCRSRGETVRSILDCVIAAVAIRSGLPIVHHDRDFDTIARHTRLTVV